MKKWLIGCLTVLAMVCLIPGIALNAKAAPERVDLFCLYCGRENEREVLGYEKYDSTDHKVLVDECSFCHKDGDVIYILAHTGGTQTPTCITGKICEKCGAEYGILGHDWGKWKPIRNMNMHLKICNRCNRHETENCGGDSNATCITQGKCTTCGGSYYGGHDWGAWTPIYDGTTYTHARSCKNCPEVDTANCTGGTATCSAKAVCEVCGGKYGERDTDNHDLVHHEAKAPTCTEKGWNAFDTCSRCNYTTYVELPAQHAFVYHQAKPATCKEIGWDAYRTCSRCDYTDYVELPALKNHNLRQYVTKAPTCTEIGFAYVRCWLCDYSTSQVLPVLNHDLKQYAAKAPTCTEKGWNAYETCSRSGCDYTTYVELPAQHDLVHHDAQAATCTGIGWDAYETCSRCDHTTYQEIPALNHDLKQHAAKAPTCTEIGWNAYETCSRCDHTTYQEIPALNHDLVQHDAKAPTCTGIGWDAYDTCSRCDHTTYQEIPALNHDLKQHAAKAATCTGIGWDAYDTCSRSGCNYTTYAELPELKHDLVQHEAQAPTCTGIGWNTYNTCSRCDYTTYAELPALNHDLEQHEAKAPTCTEIGWDAYDTCSRCSYTTYQEKAALKHDLVQHEAKAPTCTEKGWDAYETCTRCDHTTYAELPALNHALVQHDAQAPTCTGIGWNAYDTCSRCDHTTYAELPALNHALVQHDAQAPTCTGIGWNAYETCTRCDHTTYAELSALNHALVQHEAKAPTCTEIGWNAYDTCSRCNYSTYAELPALNHDYQAVTVDPTCEADGYTVFTCSHCKDSYTADPTDKLGHQFGAWSPNETGSQSAGCLRQGCVHIGSTDCRKFTFRTAEGETLIFCPVCGQAENAAQLEKIDAATAWPLSGSLSAEDVTARTNGEYLSVAFETAGSLTQPTGRVRLALPAGLLEGKKLVRIAPDGTQTELPFEAKCGKCIYTLDFANSELPVMLFRLVPQPTAL